jgi:hypothetical protein
MPRYQQVLRHAVPAVLIAALAVHFTCTLVYLMPPNPMSVRARPVVGSYMEPFFSQNWSLFAPDPVADTRLLLVSCRVEEPDGSATETPWANITSPLRAVKSRYRVGPANQLERAQLAPLYMIFPPGDALIEKVASQNEEHLFDEVLAQYEEARRKTLTDGTRLLTRVGSAECDRIHGTGRTREVALRMVTIEPPKFSQRHLPDSAGDTLYVQFPWAPYESVAAL